LKKFSEFLQEETKEFLKLLKIDHILDYLNEFREIVYNNLDFTSQYNKIIQNLILILRYNMLLKEKESLSRELELSSHYKKSRDITAITDLLKKLNESLTENKNKLKFLEEDYFQQKNQVEHIRKEIDDYYKRIQDLTKEKKKNFSEINRITRRMSGNTENSKNIVHDNVTESDVNLTNAEKIKSLQQKAKENQFEINNIKSEKNQTQLKLDDLKPIFEIYEKDYQSMLEIINNDQKRINDLQSELKDKIKDDENTQIKDNNVFNIDLTRPIQEIKENIENTNSELDKLIITEDCYNSQNPKDLSQIIQKLNEFNEKLVKSRADIIINTNEKEISECLEQFRELEDILNNIEYLTNRFLSEITLSSRFSIILKNDNKSFFIKIEFTRKDKEKVNFDELTTPEKIFFIIIFYISIKLQFKTENIIFSNVSMLSKYNKAGSIYRTIRKILPKFEIEEDLSKFNLIFILSNLELKKEIKNLKITTIKES